MEIALIKANLKRNQAIKYTTATNSSKNTEKPKPQKIVNTRSRKKNTKTHLTIIGVCTTICPENSGM